MILIGVVGISVLVIVPCGKKKIWDIHPHAGPCRAKDVYQGPLFKVCKEFAEKFAERWVILSAKYGFIDPDFVIPENYDVTFNKPSTNPIGVEELRRQAKEKGLYEYDKIVVLGGSRYIDMASKVFPQSKLRTPFKGLPLGKMIQAIKNAMKNNEFLLTA